ncbi:MAG: peptide-methionine (S)-S-oxide reductase MsrA [Gammaproteobacteria bacterium]
MIRDPARVPLPAHDLPPDGVRELVLGGGCFWCVEAVFERFEGVLDVESGYAGGTADTATYARVCDGTTDHAEVVRIRYDSAQVSFGELLRVFFTVAHDPTQRDRQGNDVGRQYRSVVFAGSEREETLAAGYIAQLDAAGVFARPIATRVERLRAFHPAERYHQDYARLNPGQPYIAAVARPKVEALACAFPARFRQTPDTGTGDDAGRAK